MAREEQSSWLSKISASVWTAIIAPVLVGLILFWLGVGRSDQDRPAPVVANPVNAPTTPPANGTTGNGSVPPTVVNSSAPATPSTGKEKAVSGSLKDF